MAHDTSNQTFDQHDLLTLAADKMNPLPRSVVRGADFQLLDGDWRFTLDARNEGLKKKWFVKHNYAITANFPGSIESYFAAVQEHKDQTNLYAASDDVIAWYERDFNVPEEWTRSGKLTQLTFGACGYETRVWLNGSLLKTIEGEKAHFGEYTSFSYELPPEILQPVLNRLTIRVVDTIDAEIPRGKQASRVYKQGGIWYQTISGAVRSVWIEPVGRNRLRSRLGVSSGLHERLVEFDFTTLIHDAGQYQLRLTVAPRNSKTDETEPVTAAFDLRLEAGESVRRVPVQMPNAKFWSPASPNLYHLKAELVADADETSAGIATHFGLRKIEARGRHVYLNNQATYLDGILYQPGTSSFDEMRRHFYAMKRLGCNLARVHIAGIDPRIYDLADEIGLMLWVEVPSPHSSTQRSRKIHRAELERMLVFIASHPSIVILSLYNEDWGAEDIKTNRQTRDYISETFDYLRLNYPQLLIVDNDGWNHVSREGRLSSHLLTAHVYTPSPSGWVSALERLAAGETHGVTAEPLVAGDEYFYRGQTPLIISEWGGFGFANYGGPTETEAEGRHRLIQLFKQEMRERAVAGDVYTQATSIEDEVNGIIEPHTGKLLVPAGLLDSSQSFDE